jgi:hypothetical protein
LHTIQNISYLPDLFNLPKEVLQKVCVKLNLPTEGKVEDLVSQIWNTINNDLSLQNEALEICKDRLLCGRTSVSWFQLQDNNDLFSKKSLSGIKESIIDNSSFDPFAMKWEINTNEQMPTPVLLCASEGDKPTEYFLRFIYTTSVKRSFEINNVVNIPKNEFATVFIDEEAGLIEVRTDSKKTKDIISSLKNILGPEYSFSKNEIVVPFGYDMERIADQLNGKLWESYSRLRPVDELSEEELKAIGNILHTLDSYFQNNDEVKLIEELKQSKEVLEGFLNAIPFTGLVLSGLENIGVKVQERDLRETPLFESFKQYL